MKFSESAVLFVQIGNFHQTPMKASDESLNINSLFGDGLHITARNIGRGGGGGLSQTNLPTLSIDWYWQKEKVALVA